MATVHCSKCTAERKGFRRELDSWRYKLIHCIGFESILEGIYGPLLLRDLNLFEDCEPEEVTDWSPEEISSHCSFCNLSLDKHNDQVLSATSPLSSPSDYSPCHVPILSESSQSAHRFLQAVFHKKDVPQDCDPNIPLIAQELMKKMIRQFAMEYASKCLLHKTSNGVSKKTTSPPSETTDAPLDLTMSRPQEEKEPQPDGVLDLSNRKSACLPTSKPSFSSTNHKGSGCCLLTFVEDPEEPEPKGTKDSALGAVLSSLCPAHQSLVYRILKLAHQQKLLFFKTLKQVKPECCCCHCGNHFDNHISHHGAINDCTCGCCQHWLIDQCSARYQPEDSNSSCSTHQFALKVCEHESDWGSNSSSALVCKRETCTIICPKKLNGHACQNPPSTDNIKGMCAHTPVDASPSSVLTLCPLSKCCSQHNNQTCSCHLMHSSVTEVKTSKCTENLKHISVLKREHSPSPPALSPSPSDVYNASDERHLVILQHTEEQAAEPGKCFVKRQKCKIKQSCQAKKKTSGSLLQDVTKCNDKHKTIKPLETSVSLALASVAEEQTLQSTSKSGQLNADAHLTEIITTVSHTGISSKCSLPKVIDHQDDKEPMRPNTRSRHRQEVLSAMATVTDDTTKRRQSQMKQKLARLDQSYCRQKKTKLKNIFFNENPFINSINCEAKNLDKAESSNYNKDVKSNNLGKPRKSKRTIVPPPRFSSYVTEPRKMYFVACFSDSIFNQKGQSHEGITSSQNAEFLDNSCATQVSECQNEATPTSKERSLIQDHSEAVGKCHRKPQPETLADVAAIPSTCSHENTCVEYTSPIKLMFISPVKDEEGMKYSLKSAAAVNGLSADECFDPCEESSWSGTPEKKTNQGTELSKLTELPLAHLQNTPSSSPAKYACLSAKSTSNKTSPKKSSITEKLDSTPKSSTSSPKSGSRRSGESTPTKSVSVDDSLKSPHEALTLHETTPPKRRPGRPKKLGPQLEKKVKRPIGRPRKEKVMQSTVNEKSVNGNTVAPDTEENVNKNLKITVLYGRSRRNKRMVSEGFDQLQTEFHDACQAVGLNNNWSMLMNTAKINSTDQQTAPAELSQNIPLIKPVKVCAKSNIKCQSLDDVTPLRKPGRPAKVKISGISVTVTTVSPRQRKIQINKDKTSPVRHNHRKTLFQQSVTAKDPKTITFHSVRKSNDLEKQTEDPKVETKFDQNPPVTIRHSERVRKPSIHFLHAVATSSSYSRSSTLVRCSKQLLLNKAHCEEKKDESHNVLPTSGEQHLRKQEKGKTRSLGLNQISSVSVESIYNPKQVKWWSSSVQEKTLNQELARRIRLISDSWVSDTVGTEAGSSSSKISSASSRKSKHSIVRSLFDCSPNKPRSCSMQQLCSWFMQTTETQSLTIVKKASSRNSFELMHFPRSTNKKSICYSPQAERLRKHLKKFAKSVPKSPYHFKQAQKKIKRKHRYSTISALDRHNKMTQRRNRSFSTYKAVLHRAKRRFFTREEWRLMNNKTLHNKHVTRLQPLPKSTAKPFCGQKLVPAHANKAYVCSKHVNPEKLKECRVFLRKINSLNNGPATKVKDLSTNTLDDGTPSLFGKREKLAAVDKAVKTYQIKRPKRACVRGCESHSPNSVRAQHVEPMSGSSHSVGVVSESLQPPPAKRTRQSRMMGLSAPRWRDFVFGN